MVQIYNARYRPQGQPAPVVNTIVLGEPVIPPPPMLSVDDSGQIKFIPFEPELKIASPTRIGPVSMAQILDVVSRISHISPGDLVGPGRSPQLSWTRGLVANLCYRYGGFSTPRIGLFLGGRHHTTILHALKEHRKRTNRRWYDETYTEARRVLNVQ